MNSFVYILELKDGTYYIGYTNCLLKRLEMHNSGKGAKRTKGRGPVKLVYYEVHPKKSDALKREYALKQLSRHAKETLVKSLNISILNPSE